MTEARDISIDIHQNKLMNWLVTRRHVPKDWLKKVLVIRQKINTAIQDMPENKKIAHLLSGSYINYFHCRKIVEILKQTEASSKNIFGKYSSQRMKDWLEIIQLYEKENVYLADAAQVLVSNIKYEIPSVRKELDKCVQMQKDCLKKESDYAKNAVKTKEKYLSTCKEIGIKGENVRKELLSLLDGLPETFSNITTSMKKMSQIKYYYEWFLTHTLQRKIDNATIMPVISYLIEKGNTTTYEWRTGEVPDVVEVTKPVLPLDIDNGSVECGDDQIDFGDLCIASESAEHIEKRDRGSSSPNGDFVHVEKEDCKVENGDQINYGDGDINWDISVVDTCESSVAYENKDNKGGKVATGEDAFTILENPTTRNLVCNELLEFKGFLEQRLTELCPDNPSYCISGDALMSSEVTSDLQKEIHFQSNSSVETMLQDVKNIISSLMSDKMKQLYLINESPKHVDRLASSLKDLLDTSEKMLLSKKVVRNNYESECKKQKDLEPKLQLMIEKTIELQEEIKEDISKRYENRRVNILGTSLSKRTVE